ncbi:hypothetical protein [Gemmatimonas sp.]|uniref:hypothetical protein n=1 Tax=Gemmatimonas sp. TaxID=1962908 RepID=UPI002ED8BDB3
MTLFRQTRTRIGLLALAGLAGCGDCVLIGCYNGLQINLDALPAGTFTISALVPGQPGEVITCVESSPCGTSHGFQDITASEVEIVINTSVGASRHTIRPQYEASSGSCGGECRFATVAVSIPR